MRKSKNSKRTGKVSVKDGYMTVDGCVKVAKLEGGDVVFHDKNRHRSQEAGSDQIHVPASDVIDVIQSHTSSSDNAGGLSDEQP